MFGITNFAFQDNCVDYLISKTNTTSKKGVIVKAPTGSGKTIMLIKYIEAYFNNFSSDTAFIWFCPGAGNLEEQSKYSMEQYSRSLVAKDLQEALTSGINAKDTIFINWEQVNKSSNKAMTESEHKSLRDQIFAANRNGVKFIVIVDEEHAYNTAKSQAVINEFNASFSIRVSATAKENKQYEWYEISERQVIAAQLITKAIIINDGIASGHVEDENKLLISMADQKRKIIKQSYEDINVDINPLVVIQFPDKSTSLISTVEGILEELGYTYENKAVAKWMSDSKVNIENLRINNGTQVFLLMKQAIATGWDCPRAKILVKLRENMSEDFQIQTIGRIRRMPERKHYNQENLDNCFIYTFDDEYKSYIKKELFSVYNVRRVKRKSNIENVSLEKENKNEDAGSLGPREAFDRVCAHFTGKYNLTSDSSNNTSILAANGYNFSKEIEYAAKTGKFVLTEDTIDSETKIDLSRTVKTHDDSLPLRQTVDMLKTIIKVDYQTSMSILRKLFYKSQNGGKLLKLDNHEFYAFIINNKALIKDEYQELMSSVFVTDSMLMLNPKKSIFKIPDEELLMIDEYYEDKTILAKNVYEDYTCECFVKRSRPERLFERYCERDNSVEWIYKNGDSGQEYFSIVYLTGMLSQRLFYPDYIVKKTNGDLWIIECKGGESASGVDNNIDPYAEAKFNALKRYASEHNVKFGFVRDKVINDMPRLMINKSTYTEDMGDEWKSIETNF